MTEYQDYPSHTASNALHSTPFQSKLFNRQVGDVLAGKYCVEHILWESKKSGVYLVNRTIKGTTVREVLKILALNVGSHDTKKWDNLISAHRRANHPNLVAIRDSDALPDSDAVYVTMDFMTEGTWAERFRQARQRGEMLNLAELLSAMSGIAAAIAALHREGIIHQDIKPENMFVCPVHGAKLGDFDVAVMQHELREDGPQRIGGTIAYMSPEQKKIWYNRDQTQISYAGDVYSFAVSLYHLITGSFPSRRSPSLHEFIADETLAAGLEHFLDRCLEEDPTDRYEDGATMEAAFNPIVRKFAKGEDEAARIYRGAFRYVLQNAEESDPIEREHLTQLQRELGLSELQILRIEEAETIVHESDAPNYSPIIHREQVMTATATKPRRRRGTRFLAMALLCGGLATAGLVSLPAYGPISRGALLSALHLDGDRQDLLEQFDQAAQRNDLDAMQRHLQEYRQGRPSDSSSLTRMERRLARAEKRAATIEKARTQFSEALKMGNKALAELALDHLDKLQVDTTSLRQVLAKHEKKNGQPATTNHPEATQANNRTAAATKEPKTNPKPQPELKPVANANTAKTEPLDEQNPRPVESPQLDKSHDNNGLVLTQHETQTTDRLERSSTNHIRLDNHPALQNQTQATMVAVHMDQSETQHQTQHVSLEHQPERSAHQQQRRSPEEHIQQFLNRVLPNRKDARALQQREIDRALRSLNQAVHRRNPREAGRHITTLKLHDALGVIEKRKICSTGDDYYNRKHYQEARAWYQLLDGEPHPEIKYRLGLVHYNLEDWQNAYQAFESAYNMGFEDAQPFLDRLRGSLYQAGVSH